VVQIRLANPAGADLLPLVRAALETCRQALDAGALVTIEPGRSRIRILPLARLD